MVSVQPQLWADQAGTAVAFYERAFGARVLMLVGEGEDVVAQLSVGEACFWVAATAPDLGRLSPADGGTTGRVLLVPDNAGDVDALVHRAVAAGATLLSEPEEEHLWYVGRVRDPSGHEWEIGRPTGEWPPG